MASERAFRERSVLVFGDEAAANHMYFELSERIRQLQEAAPAVEDPVPHAHLQPTAPAVKPKASQRWADSTAMLTELRLEQCAAAAAVAGQGVRGARRAAGFQARSCPRRYIVQFEEEEMTSIELLEEIVSRVDGERELMDALKEMGIKKMGHRQAIVGAVARQL